MRVAKNFDDLRLYDLIPYHKDEQIVCGLRAFGFPAERDWFFVRCDNQALYWELVKSGNDLCFIQTKIIQQVEFIARVLPDLKMPPLETRFAAYEKVVRT